MRAPHSIHHKHKTQFYNVSETYKVYKIFFCRIQSKATYSSTHRFAVLKHFLIADLLWRVLQTCDSTAETAANAQGRE